VIATERLELHTVRPEEYAILAVDRADPRLWHDRGFTNPYGHLVDDPGPLPFRLPRIAANPAAAPWLLRMAVHRGTREIVGSSGFHDLPNDDGMVEIGLEIVPPWRRQGLAREMLEGMWRWAVQQPGVEVLRYTVSPTNEASVRLIAGFGFQHVGVQMDEIDGPEDIYEMAAESFRSKYR
jgi:RimJ/RimL family protein N-acetyltransferase